MTDKKVKKSIDCSIENKENSVVEITGSVAWNDLAPYREKALVHMAKHVEIDGFRAGKAPIEKVQEKIGVMPLLSEAAQSALSDVYTKVVIENNLRIIGSPDIAITKLAENNPLEYKITTAVFPEITLGDYKAISKEANKNIKDVVVTDKETEEAIEKILEMNAHTHHEHAEGEECDHSDDEKPEFNDEFVKTLGDFKNTDDFKEKLVENIKLQKEREAQAKSREIMMTEIIEKSSFDVPELLVRSELEKMIAQMKDDVSRMGLEYTEWLKHMGKTEEEMTEGWSDDAKKRAQSELVLKEIAAQEKLKPDTEKVNQQIELMKEQYGDEVPEANLRLYVESIFLNEETLSFLEGLK